MTVTVVELAAGGDLARAVATVTTDVVAVVPPGTRVVDPSALADAYAALDARVVLAASPTPTGKRPPIDAPTPYRYVAPALIGEREAVRELATLDVERLARAYLEGADLELDIGAELFLVRDNTGTDAVVLGASIVATATGTRPLVVLGGTTDLTSAGAAGDLALVFAYDGAAAPVTDAEIVAPEILRVPCWTGAMCAAVIRAAEAANAWGNDTDDPVPGLEVSLHTLSPRLFAHLETHLEEVIVPAWRAVWPEIAWNGVHDAFVIKYTAGAESASLPLHHDIAQISASIRLNDGYDGGALEFPRQQFDNRGVPVGDLLAWPSLVTHPHRGASVTRGVKYGLTVWLRLPE